MNNTKNSEKLEVIYKDTLTIISGEDHSFDQDNALVKLFIKLGFDKFKVSLSASQINAFEKRLDVARRFLKSEFQDTLKSLEIIEDELTYVFETFLTVDPKENVDLATKICEKFLEMESEFERDKKYMEKDAVVQGNKELRSIAEGLAKDFPVEFNIALNNKYLKAVV